MGFVDLVLREEGAFERLFAQKRLHAQHRDDPDVRAMFLDEARIAGMLRHPNVVSVLDVGEDDEGPWLVMDLVEGVSVAELLADAAKRGTVLPISLCAEIARQAAEGLHAAHEQRGHDGEPLALVHRDVSPPNLLVGFDGTVRVTDFGIAKAIGRTSRTITGELKGKLGYMSPEQLRFDELDRRSDLFSLGVVLVELLTGTRLYPASEDGPRRILSEPPPDVGELRPDAPPELVELVFELLAKDRTARPADARSVARRLGAIVAEAALVEDEVSIADWLEEHFGESSRAERVRIAEAIQALDRTPRPPGGEGRAYTGAFGLPASRRRPRVPPVAVALGLGGLALVAGLFLWLAVRPAEPPPLRSAPMSGATASPPPTIFAPPPAIAPVAAGEGGFEEPRVAPAPAIAPAAALPEEGAPAPSPAKRRERRGGREPGAEVPHWGWEGR